MKTGSRFRSNRTFMELKLVDKTDEDGEPLPF